MPATSEIERWCGELPSYGTTISNVSNRKLLSDILKDRSSSIDLRLSPILELWTANPVFHLEHMQ